jgi:HAD superfamily hydrolase (TIGR01458 family)
VTNTTAHSRNRTLDKLARLGFSVADPELVTPAALAVRHCVERARSRVALIMNDEVKCDFEPLEETEHGSEAVIIGDLGEAFSYDVLNRAFREVMNGAELIALQKNRYWLRTDGLSLDVGPFVAAIEFATGRDAYVVGKPARGFFEQVLGDLGVDAQETAMVGDDIKSDIGRALRAGLGAILGSAAEQRRNVSDRPNHYGRVDPRLAHAILTVLTSSDERTRRACTSSMSGWCLRQRISPSLSLPSQRRCLIRCPVRRVRGKLRVTSLAGFS